MVLTLDGVVAEDAATLESLGMLSGATLALKGKLHVNVDIGGGKTVDLEVETSDTIGSIKAQLEGEKNVLITAAEMELSLDEEQLEDDAACWADVGIDDGAQLAMKGPMMVKVRKPDKQCMRVSALPTDTIAALQYYVPHAPAGPCPRHGTVSSSRAEPCLSRLSRFVHSPEAC